MDNLIKEWKKDNGDLYSLEKYISYRKPDREVVLDGIFQYAELVQILKHMKSVMNPRELGA